MGLWSMHAIWARLTSRRVSEDASSRFIDFGWSVLLAIFMLLIWYFGLKPDSQYPGR